ncbi:MAG: SLBB domain-containing protein [Gemmatimonadota bacterium]
MTHRMETPSRPLRLFVGAMVVLGLLWAVPASSATAQDVQDARRLMQQQGMTEEDVLRQLQASGISRAELRSRLQAAGLDGGMADMYFDRMEGRGSGPLPEPSSDFLRAIGGMEGDGQTSSGAASGRSEPRLQDLGPTIFGRSLFRRDSDQFDPILTGPVPGDYRLGPDDQIQLFITGDVETVHQLAVTREGALIIPDVGQIFVNGLTLAQLEARLFDELGRVYSGVRRGSEATTRFHVSLGQLRLNQVFIIGEVERPGAYQVPATATIFNALYLAEGPTRSGSFRNVQLRRSGQVVRTLDVYDYLVRGDSRDDVRLEQGDVIFVPPVGPQVRVEGDVRRSGSAEQRDVNLLREQLTQLNNELRTAHLEMDRFLQVNPTIRRRNEAMETARRNGGVLDSTLVDVSPVVEFEYDQRRRNISSILSVVQTVEEQLQEVRREEVLRPSTMTLYEVVDGESLEDVLTFAGGPRANAFLRRVQIDRILPPGEREPGRDRVLLDADLNALTSTDRTVEILDGDIIRVFPVSDERRNRVAVVGEVNRPGDYEYRAGMTAWDLIRRADGLHTSAYRSTAHVRRLVPADSSVVLIPLSLEVDEGGNSRQDVELMDLDEVRVFGRAALINPRNVQISGEVKQPGSYELAQGMTVRDVILMAGGFTPGAVQYEAEVARMVSRPTYSDTLATVVRVPLDLSLAPTTGPDSQAEAGRLGARAQVPADFELEDGDRVFVRPMPGYQPVETVEVRGEVLFPGFYPVEARFETVARMIQKAGGATNAAYVEGFRVIRDSIPVAVDLMRALENPGGSDDVVLEPGDELIMPAFDPTVQILGSVQFETRVLYREGMGLEEYLDRAGGMLESGDFRRVNVEYANGSRSAVRRKLLLFRSTPSVEPGSTIYVPPKPPASGLNLDQFLTRTVSLATAVATLIIAVNQVR